MLPRRICSGWLVAETVALHLNRQARSLRGRAESLKELGRSFGALEWSAFHAFYANGTPRNQPFHPAMMVKVLL